VAPSAVMCPHVTAYPTGLRRTGSLPVFRTRCHVRARGRTHNAADDEWHSPLLLKGGNEGGLKSGNQFVSCQLTVTPPTPLQ